MQVKQIKRRGISSGFDPSAKDEKGDCLKMILKSQEAAPSSAQFAPNGEKQHIALKGVEVADIRF